MPAMRPILSLLVGLAAFAALGASFAVLDPGGAENGRGLALAVLFQSIAFGLLAVSGALLTRRRLSDALGLLPIRSTRRDVLFMIAGTLALSHLSDACIDWLDLGDGTSLARLVEAIAGSRGEALAWLVVAIGSAGVSEELLCRGWIQRGVGRHFGLAAGWIVSSLVFAALHADPVHSSFALVMGLYFGAMMIATGGVLTPMAAHVVNNAIATLGAAYELDPPLWADAFAALVFAASLPTLLRTLRPAVRDANADDDG